MSEANDDDNSREPTAELPALRLVRFRVDPSVDLRGVTFRFQSTPTICGEAWLDMNSDADVTFYVNVDDE